MEARLALELKKAGQKNFVIECMDINAPMLERGIVNARRLGVAGHLGFFESDFNSWTPTNHYDVILANQCLHHVLELEHLFASCQQAMIASSRFLTSDMVGRNGHQRWPEALELVRDFWTELPRKYRYNRLLKRYEDNYINHDCSREGFEGIRAQDILPLLNENFSFELFIPFANVVNVFIDRAFGWNFDENAAWDMDFIDRVHAADENAMLNGSIKPTQILAALRKSEFSEAPKLWHQRMTPEFCTRVTT